MVQLNHRESRTESWPWQELLDPEILSQWLGGDIEGERDGLALPPALLAMLRSLEQVVFGDQWCQVLEGGERIPGGLILDTRDVLIDFGYRSELVGSLVVALLASGIKAQGDTALQWTLPVESLSLNVAKAALGGLIGPPDEETIDWLLENAAACGSEEAVQLAKLLKNAQEDDAQARDSIVKNLLPYWHAIANAGLLSQWNEYVEVLGFPYKYAEEIKDQPDVLALRANLLYVNGHAGQEEEAVRLASAAAIRGSGHAWSLLNEWRQSGDEDLVLRSLLSVGSLHLAGSDCLVSNE